MSETVRVVNPETGEIIEPDLVGAVMDRIRLGRLQWKSRYNKNPQRIIVTEETYSLLPLSAKADQKIHSMTIEVSFEVAHTGVIGSGEFVLMEFPAS